jgi:L-seryl-tRNA(Ser) seleniumtransferase
VARAAAHPVARAVRPDKLTLAALAATLKGWKTGAWRRFPVYRAAGASLEELEERGARILGATLEGGGSLRAEIAPSKAAFGGGTSPEKLFASRALSLSHPAVSAQILATRLRSGSPPVVPRVEEERVILDLRSILPEEDPIVAASLAALSR